MIRRGRNNRRPPRLADAATVVQGRGWAIGGGGDSARARKTEEGGRRRMRQRRGGPNDIGLATTRWGEQMICNPVSTTHKECWGELAGQENASRSSKIASELAAHAREGQGVYIPNFQKLCQSRPVRPVPQAYGWAKYPKPEARIRKTRTEPEKSEPEKPEPQFGF